MKGEGRGPNVGLDGTRKSGRWERGQRGGGGAGSGAAAVSKQKKNKQQTKQK